MNSRAGTDPIHEVRVLLSGPRRPLPASKGEDTLVRLLQDMKERNNDPE